MESAYARSAGLALLGRTCSIAFGQQEPSHRTISIFPLRAAVHSQQFYQFISTDKTGVKLKEYSIGLRFAENEKESAMKLFLHFC